MFNIVLYQPEIPPNTGNIIRLCANAGFHLHLIQPLGFSIEDKHLKRAGLDYEMQNPIQIHETFSAYEEKLESIHSNTINSTTYLCTTKAQRVYSDVVYQPGDNFVFGPETRGLPTELLSSYPSSQLIKIPMQTNSRSLNLSNAVAVILYEAWRQNNFR